MQRVRVPISEKGQASVESLFVIIIIAAVLFGAFKLAQGVSLRHAIDTGTSLAARALSINPSDYGYAAALIQSHVDDNVMGQKPAVVVNLYDDQGGLITPGVLAGMGFSDGFIVEAEVPFTYSVPFVSNTDYTLRVRHWGIVERYP
jgi:hypothetical protein